MAANTRPTPRAEVSLPCKRGNAATHKPAAATPMPVHSLREIWRLSTMRESNATISGLMAMNRPNRPAGTSLNEYQLRPR